MKWKQSKECAIGNKPIRSVPAKLFLINKSREELYVSSTTLDFLLKLYGILEDQGSVLVAEFRYLCRDSKVFGITRCLNT